MVLVASRSSVVARNNMTNMTNEHPFYRHYRPIGPHTPLPPNSQKKRCVCACITAYNSLFYITNTAQTGRLHFIGRLAYKTP